MQVAQGDTQFMQVDPDKYYVPKHFGMVAVQLFLEEEYVNPDTHDLHLLLLVQVAHGDTQLLHTMLDLSKYYVDVHVGLVTTQVDVELVNVYPDTQVVHKLTLEHDKQGDVHALQVLLAVSRY